MFVLEMPALRIAQRIIWADVAAILAELIRAFVVRQEIGFEIALKIPRLAVVFGDESAGVFGVEPDPKTAIAEIVELDVGVIVIRRQDAQRFKQAKLSLNTKAVVRGMVSPISMSRYSALPLSAHRA